MKVRKPRLIYFWLLILVIIALNTKPILLSGIKFYQRNISPLPGVTCRYVESCSNYGERMVQQHGAVIGSILTVEQVWQCSRIQIPHIQKNNDFSDKESEEAGAKACAYGCCGTGILAILVPIFIGILACGVLIALTIYLIRRSKR